MASYGSKHPAPDCGNVVTRREGVHHLHYPEIPGAEASTDLVL